ncbi:MAG: class I SAM-dependent methyltransferase [Verrucomicrobiota bacterium]
MNSLRETEKSQLLERYAGKFEVRALEYGTVQDYCDSCDHLPWISRVQHDLKDSQRPWTVKAALGLSIPGSRLLEIGAGPPLVSGMLTELGYDLTIVDPYDGSAGGPAEFETFLQRYPDIRFVREQFTLHLPQLEGELFDGIFSVSVLEHVAEPALEGLFAAVAAHLRPGGCSFHSVDCVTQGNDAEYHLDQCLRIALYQSALAGERGPDKGWLRAFFNKADQDVETCYLSAAGHNLWRGAMPYATFPFRKVLSFQTVATRQLNGSNNWQASQSKT